ncbi:MAG: hypothetical protein ACQKBT_01055, partial [Puniceicoccales bacterium]
AFLQSENSTGYRFFWTAGEGRRDLGQQFSVGEKMVLSSLAVQINSGTRNFPTESPVRLTFAKASTDRPDPAEVIATFDGIVSKDSADVRSGRWLYFQFPEIELEPGFYAFTLEYLKEGGEGHAIVLNVGGGGVAFSGGRGIQSQGEADKTWQYGRPINFILSESGSVKSADGETVAAAQKTVNVDQRGGADYTNLTEAVKELNPGDTLVIAPGSGPYRESLFINRSGEENRPIVVEGNGELITGFEPITNFRAEDGRVVADLEVEFPFVLSYRGERLFQDSRTEELSQYASLSGDREKLILHQGVSPEGWEISTRYFGVRVENVSHHVYRNLRASGTTNDGFNLHGKGEGLVFENIEGFQNLDEGFSAHDEITCVIREGAFFENDNGIGNVGNSDMDATDIEVFDNLGWGLWLRDCRASLSGVTAWGNGISQMKLSGHAKVRAEKITVREPDWIHPVYLSYKESSKSTEVVPLVIDSTVSLVETDAAIEVIGAQSSMVK